MATKSISQLDSASSVSASDLYEVAVPDAQSVSGYASKKESGAQIATFFHEQLQNNNLNTTAKTIVGAINEVDSEDVKWSEENYLGAKNLLQCPYDTTGANPRGATFEVLENGGIHISGTVGTTNDGYIYIVSYNFESAMELNGLIKFGFHGSGTNIDKVNFNGAKRVTSSGTRTSIGSSEEGAGHFVEYNANESDARYDFEFKLTKNTTYDVTVYPMVMYASIADESYTPPSETNRELTLKKVSWDSANFLGAKNVIPYPYYHGQSYSHNGVDFTVGDDGTITANGRASGNARFFFAYDINLENGTYILSDGGVGTANDYLGIVYYLKSAPSTTQYIDLTDAGEVIFTKDDTWDRATIRLWLRNNTEVSNKKYYPMLRPVSVVNKEYEAQAESNRTLTLFKCSMSSIATVENSDMASKAYSIGDYMFHYGKFYKVTSAISQGGAITINTNIAETTIGAELKAALTS